MRNPSIGGVLDHHIRSCPTYEVTDDIAALLAAYQSRCGREGMILTANGKLLATVSNRRLLMLAAAQDKLSSERRLRRAERIERASADFQSHASGLASQMVTLADQVQQLAEATVSRASLAGRRPALWSAQQCRLVTRWANY
jgi:methyl-accepting chemotaxis protein